MASQSMHSLVASHLVELDSLAAQMKLLQRQILQLECSAGIFQDSFTEASKISEALAEHHTILIEGDWFSHAHKAGLKLHARQDMEAKFHASTLSALLPGDLWEWQLQVGGPSKLFLHMNTCKAATWLLAAVSYPWLSKHHPDPDSWHLQVLSNVVRGFKHAMNMHQKRLAMFLDYASLHQDLPDRLRTPEEQCLFKKGLKSVNLWYTHRLVQVWILSVVPKSAPNPVGYHDRGWTTFERLVSLFLTTAVFDFGELSMEASSGGEALLKDAGTFIHLSENLRACRKASKMEPPMLPKYFDEVIETKHFTNGKTDKPFVKAKYEDTFIQVMSAAKEMEFSAKGWNIHLAYLQMQTGIQDVI